MGCASVKSSKKDKKESEQRSPPQENNNRLTAEEQPKTKFKFIDIQVKKIEGQKLVDPIENVQEVVKDKSQIVEQKQQIAETKPKVISLIEAPSNKQNKQKPSKQQLLKKYNIVVNNQRVLPINSYRYDILLPHNPQMGQTQTIRNPTLKD